MPTQLQLRRGSTSQNDAFTGAAGEVSVDTTLDNLRLHDGSQAGGFEIPGLGTTGQIGLCGNNTPAASTVSIGTPANVIIRTNTHEGNVIIGDATATSPYKLDVRGTSNASIVYQEGAKLIPSGVVVPYGKATAPGGWLLCDDSAVSRTTYADLFSAIGTLFGTGNGSTTFNVPAMGDRLPLGKGTNNGTIGGETAGAAASAVVATASGSAALTLTTGTFATSAKDSSTASALTNVTAGGHTHNLTLPVQVFQYIIKT